ncbi:MAG: CAP domain-containing protein [Limimaricola soesokkakensis]|uniref:CAP domain-containing protein n=1 Tax=Limimaricola soesokkakensis TaxID=1343159 RepID=UPI0040597D40
MTRRTTHILAGVIALAASLGQSAPGATAQTSFQTCLTTTPVKVRQNVLKLVNARREARGLPSLSLQPKLNRAAQTHSCDMGRASALSHTGTDGSNVMDRAQREGYRPCLIAENVAAGHQSARDVVRSWMQSPPHRQNILRPDARHLGLGFASPQNGGSPHWTQVFARPC